MKLKASYIPEHLSCKHWPWKSVIVSFVGFIIGFTCVYLVNFIGRDQPGEILETQDTVQSEIDPLVTSVSILCWVMTSPKTHSSRAQHVKNTWGRQCNHLIFMSSIEDERLGAVALPVKEGRDHLWAKTKESLLHLYKHHRESADWFFKADDDTYAIMANMRRLVSNLKAEQFWYLGNRFSSKELGVYAGGGSGYVLSRAALERVVEEGLNDPSKCRQDHDGYEDVELGKCLANVGVSITDTRDYRQSMMFLPYMVNVHADEEQMAKEDKKWFHEFTSENPVPKGMASCSQDAVTFHYVTPTEMYELDFLTHRLKLFGKNHCLKPVTSKRVNV